MNVFILALIGLGLFLALAILRKWFDSFILIAFSIGAACNANFYHALTTPVPCGPFILAIDSSNNGRSVIFCLIEAKKVLQ